MWLFRKSEIEDRIGRLETEVYYLRNCVSNASASDTEIRRKITELGERCGFRWVVNRFEGWVKFKK